MNTVFSALLRELQEKRSSMLVVIIAEDGSSPRGAGSMMLVGENGRIAGTIGGGAVEKRSEEEAQRLLAQRASGLHEYRLHQNDKEDIGMVCGGDVKVLFQFISAGAESWLTLAEDVLARLQYSQPGWLLLRLDGGQPALLDERRACEAGVCPQETAETVPQGMALHQGFFSMPLPVGKRAILFGGGHIAMELAPLLQRVGFRIVVFDDRREFSSRERFPMAEQTICGDYEDIETYLTLQADDYIVVITEGHRHDFAVERQALAHPLAYIGAIGSKIKTAAVNQRLLDCGFREADLKRLHAPIGTKIKAVTPAEIAVSITGEMILVRAEHLEEETGLRKSCPMS